MTDPVVIAVALAIVGLLIAYLFYSIGLRKQREQSEPFQQAVLNRFDEMQERAFENRMAAVRHHQLLEDIEETTSKFQDTALIEERLANLELKIKSSLKATETTASLADILEYKSLGDRWSEVKYRQSGMANRDQGFEILSSTGQIDIQRLLNIHSSIFPIESPWAGVLRTTPVFIVDHYGTASTVIDSVGVDVRINTVAPEEIQPSIDRLFEHWNERVEGYARCENRKKVGAVSQFHHEFELIHPFHDGNGRIGRILISEQLSYLFNQRVFFDPVRTDYYEALRLMNMGEAARLRDIVIEQLEENGVRV